MSALGTPWEAITDRVMGGVSRGHVARECLDGRPCLRLTGDVRLENNGGFVQAALDLDPGGDPVDLTGFAGIRLEVRGNEESYSLHLRTADVRRPWQSYRAHFVAGADWEVVVLPFADFVAHRIDAALDLSRVRRLGLVAIGRAFAADLAVARIGLDAGASARNG